MNILLKIRSVHVAKDEQTNRHQLCKQSIHHSIDQYILRGNWDPTDPKFSSVNLCNQKLYASWESNLKVATWPGPFFCLSTT